MQDNLDKEDVRKKNKCGVIKDIACFSLVTYQWEEVAL